MINIVRLEKKTVDWRTSTFPEQNPYDVKVPPHEDEKEECVLYNYRWKTDRDGGPKAVIMMFHGYGSYTGKYAYYAK